MLLYLIFSVSTSDSASKHWKKTKESLNEMGAAHVSTITARIRWLPIYFLGSYFSILYLKVVPVHFMDFCVILSLTFVSFLKWKFERMALVLGPWLSYF